MSNSVRRYFSILLSAILSGFCITLGATAYLIANSEGQKYLGMFLFGVGLFTIIHFELYLYTGKVGYLINNKPNYLIDLFITLVGNMVGSLVLSYILLSTRNGNNLEAVCKGIVNTKQNDSYHSIYIQSIMCGVMIFLAVEGHKKCEYPLGKVIFAFMPIVVFIACGYEHCVANVTYYTYAGVFNLRTFVNFIIMIIGNAMGSIIFLGLIKMINYFKTPKSTIVQ